MAQRRLHSRQSLVSHWKLQLFLRSLPIEAPLRHVPGPFNPADSYSREAAVDGPHAFDTALIMDFHTAFETQLRQTAEGAHGSYGDDISNTLSSDQRRTHTRRGAENAFSPRTASKKQEKGWIVKRSLTTSCLVCIFNLAAPPFFVTLTLKKKGLRRTFRHSNFKLVLDSATPL
jgi:hypothetical protein